MTCGEQLAIELTRLVHARFRVFAAYWIGHTLRDAEAEDIPGLIETFATAPVDIRLDGGSLALFGGAAWCRVPTRMFGRGICSALHSLLCLEPRVFHVRVDGHTFELAYSRFKFNRVVDNRLRREACVRDLLTATLALFPTAQERAVAAAVLAAMCRDVAASACNNLHPLRRALCGVSSALEGRAGGKRMDKQKCLLYIPAAADDQVHVK